MSYVMAGMLTMGPLLLGTFWLLSDLAADWTPWDLRAWLRENLDQALLDRIGISIAFGLVMCCLLIPQFQE